MTAEKQGGEKIDLPTTLTEFLKAEMPAAKFLKSMNDMAELPGDDDQAEALSLCLSDAKYLARAIDLVRLGTRGDIDRRIRRLMQNWCVQIVRGSHPDLAEFRRIGGISPEGGISKVASKLKEARKKDDKQKIVIAEQILRVSLIEAASRPGFDISNGLVEIHRSLHLERPDKKELSARLEKYFLRAPQKVIENASALARLLRQETQPLRDEISLLRGKLDQVEAKNTKLIEEHESLKLNIAQLREENEKLNSEIDAEKGKLVGVQGGADHDRIELVARFRSTLKKKIQPNVEEASEGLGHSPPNVEFAKHRVKLLKRLLEEELEWLDQSLD